MCTINICLSCDNNYVKQAGVVIASILANCNKDEKIKIFILNSGINSIDKDKIISLKKIHNCEIKFIKINPHDFNEYSEIKTHAYITLPAYYRLKIASLFPKLDKIIYLDCDTVINCSLKELFETDLENFLLGGVIDINKKMQKKLPGYVNSGVLVMNLKQIKIEKTEKKFLEWTKNNKNKITNGDQEIINEVCKNRIKIIDDSWNVQSSNFINRSSYTSHPKIIHFVAKKKPWDFASFSYHKDFYFKYLDLTPWRLNLIEKKYWINKNKISSLLGYLKYRPLFFMRPRFYKAIYYTYINKY